jgi:hypothetical protein
LGPKGAEPKGVAPKERVVVMTVRRGTLETAPPLPECPGGQSERTFGRRDGAYNVVGKLEAHASPLAGSTL